MYFVYIIYSPLLDKYYVGSTQNVESRLNDHNNSRSKFTKKGKPWMLRWTSSYQIRSEAVNAEMKIKKMKSRKYIEALISDN